MRTILAFSTGAMMYRLLAKLLGRKEMDYQKWQDLVKRLQNKPDELKDAEAKMSTAQKLVEKNGVMEKFIDDRLLQGVDPSYKTQLTNWAWQALSEEKAFNKYVGSFTETAISANDHYVTEFSDCAFSFCDHFKKHADFRQQCQEINRRLTGKPGCIPVSEFVDAIKKMDKEWDAKKKYVVNDKTIADSWAKIERNKIDVDGSWGTFVAYRIPSWADLMQVAHQTNWCVAQKGNSGERYYRHYGEPYYLICDAPRSPFALLNPPSHQYKDVKDNSIHIGNGGRVLPTHRRAIVFGKAVLDKVSPGKSLYGDFECFNHVDEILRMDEADRNDKTDYDAVVDSMVDEDASQLATDTFAVMMKGVIDSGNQDWTVIRNLQNEYEEKTDEEKRNAVSEIASTTRKTYVFVVEDCMKRDDIDSLMKLVVKNVAVIDGFWRNEKTIRDSIIGMIDDCVGNVGYNRYSEIFEMKSNLDELVERLLINATKEEKDTLVKFVLSSNNCSKALCDEVMKDYSIDDLKGSMMKAVVKGIDNGKLDKSIFDRLAEIIDADYRANVNGYYGRSVSGFDDQALCQMMRSENCPEKIRERVFNENSRDYWNVRNMGHSFTSPMRTAIINSTGSIVDGFIERMKNANDYRFLVRSMGSGNEDKYECIAALRNKKCPKELVDRILENLDYGEGYTLSRDEGRHECVFSALLESGLMSEEQFMRMLKANPRLIVAFGWNSPYCTDAVKLALVKKVGKQNGRIFHFNDDENPLVIQEFLKSRLSAHRYGDYETYVREKKVPDNVMRDALMKIRHDKPNGEYAISTTCASDRLSTESVKYILDNLDKCYSPMHVGRYLLRRKDVPSETVDKLIDSDSVALLEVYVESHPEQAYSDEIVKIARKYFDRKYDNSAASLRRTILTNPNCPEDIVVANYDQSRKSIFSVVVQAIRKGLYPCDKLCTDIAEFNDGYYGDGASEIMKAVLETDKFSPPEKTAMLMRCDFDKVGTSLMDEIAKKCAGKSLFSKVKLTLDHTCDDRGRYLAENENYTKEEIASIINRNYGVTEGYYNRFGVDQNVLNSKHLYKLIDNHFSDFSKDDRKAILHCGNEDAMWMMKKYIRDEMKIERGVRNASRLNHIAMRVAMGRRIETIALSVAKAFM